jgi:predicted PurR-regulated permease PerM
VRAGAETGGGNIDRNLAQSRRKKPVAKDAATASDAASGPLRRSRVTGWPIAATLAVIVVLAYIIRYALLPFVLAIAVAFVAEPLVGHLQRRLGIRRWIAAALLATLIVLLLAGATYWIGREAIADLSQFARRAPHVVYHFVGALIGPQVVLFGHAYTPDDIVRQLGRLITDTLGADTAMKAASAGMRAVFGGVLTLVLIPYIMISAPRLSAGAIWMIPPERRHSVVQLLPKIIPALRRYLAGVLGVVTYTAAIAYTGFGLIFQVPHAVLLSITVGVLEMIPVAGPFASAALVALTAFEARSLAAIMVLVAFAVALRLSIDNLVGPILLGKAGHVHPVVVIFSFVCGAMLFGVVGLLLAVPTAVCIRIILQHYYAEPIEGAGRGP